MLTQKANMGHMPHLCLPSCWLFFSWFLNENPQRNVSLRCKSFISTITTTTGNREQKKKCRKVLDSSCTFGCLGLISFVRLPGLVGWLLIAAWLLDFAVCVKTPTKNGGINNWGSCTGFQTDNCILVWICGKNIVLKWKEMKSCNK